MNLNVDITWMPVRWGRLGFRLVDWWTSKSFGPGEGGWDRTFFFAIGRLTGRLVVRQYAP